MTTATNYDILVNQQVLYSFDFGLNNWTKEVWIKLRWSTSDRRKKFIPITFVIIFMIMLAEILFDCSAFAFDLPYGVVLLEESLAFISNSIEPNIPPSVKNYIRY